MTQSVVFIKQTVRCDSQLYLFSRLSGVTLSVVFSMLPGVTQSVVFIQQAVRCDIVSCIQYAARCDTVSGIYSAGSQAWLIQLYLVGYHV